MVRFAAVPLVVVLIASAARAPLAAAGPASTTVHTQAGDVGAYTSAQAEAGAGMYRTNCSACHGVRLEGTARAPALVGPAIAGRWPIGTLYGFVSRQMPADRRGALGARTYDAIVAFLLRENHHPPGRSPLTAVTAAKRFDKL